MTSSKPSRRRCGELQREHGTTLTQDVIPALKERGIELITAFEDLSEEDVADIREDLHDQRIPRADAAGGGSGASLSLHLEPLPLAGGGPPARYRRGTLCPASKCRRSWPAGCRCPAPIGTCRSSWSSPPISKRFFRVSRFWGPTRSGSPGTPISRSTPTRRTICSR